MSSRRLDISSLLCNDDDVPPHRPRPASTPTMTHQLPAATPKPLFLGLDALVHVATEERRRLSGGSESVSSRRASPVEEAAHSAYAYPSVHQVRQVLSKQTYAPLAPSPAHPQSPTYSPYPQQPHEHTSFHQPHSEHRSPISPYTRPEEELRYQHIQRQKQEIIPWQDQRPQHQRLPQVVHSDASLLALPPLRSPSMPLQVEDPEQLHSRASPVVGRPRSASIVHKYPSSPMQLDTPTSLSISRGSPRLTSSVSHDSPVSTGLPAPLLRDPGTLTYQSPSYHDTSYPFPPSTFLREMHSPLLKALGAPMTSQPSHKSAVSEGLPPSKKRRHSNSPLLTTVAIQNTEGSRPSNFYEQISSVETRVSETASPAVPPPIAVMVGPSIPCRPAHDVRKQPPLPMDQPVRERESHKVVSALGRRSPPGSAVGRAKAAKKVDEMERSLREAGKKEPSTPHLPRNTLASSVSSGIVSSETVRGEERKLSAMPGSTKAKHEDTHEWFLQQFDKSPSPPPSQDFHPAVSLSDPASVPPVTSVPAPIPNTTERLVLLDNQGQSSSPPRMSEDVVAALEQELEELLAEPDETPENKMDVDIDRAVTQLVSDTLNNGQGEEEEEESHTDRQDTDLTEADVDIELLRLVDDQLAPPVADEQQSEVAGRIASLVSEKFVRSSLDESVVKEQIISTVPCVARPKSSEREAIHLSAPATDSAAPKGKDQEMYAEEYLTAKKASKHGTGWKRKEVGPKSAKSKPTSTIIKPKAKSATKSKARMGEGTATPPPVPLKANKVSIPPPVKKSVSSAASRSRSTSVMPTGSVGPEGDNKTAEEEERSDTTNDDDKLYCVCKTRYDEDRLMIACDRCDEWYHTQCVNISDLVVDLVDQFFCPTCIQRNPHMSLRTTYKQRCLNGLKHSHPDSPHACHKPALGGGMLSKFCSQDCGIKYMENRINTWVKKGGKRENLWESVKHGEKREGVVIHVEASVTECIPKIEDIQPSIAEVEQEVKPRLIAEKWQVKATKSHLEVERLKNTLHHVAKIREDIKKGMEVVLWREKLLQLAAERAKGVGQCGWDQRLCFGDGEWAEFGMGVLESYESKVENNATDNDMQIDGIAEEGEWWCPGKTVCDRHAGWQAIRLKDISKEKEQKEEALARLTTRERELRKRIEDIIDPHNQDVKDTPKKTPLKLSNSNGHSNAAFNVDLSRKGKKRKPAV
ncbi:hypothetical protein AX15_004827 [Amanita polypyramis BW_CC]|nr:hypothetical protein AX15_004827 [Amanita polypyramis BW_CC]